MKSKKRSIRVSEQLLQSLSGLRVQPLDHDSIMMQQIKEQLEQLLHTANIELSKLSSIDFECIIRETQQMNLLVEQRIKLENKLIKQQQEREQQMEFERKEVSEALEDLELFEQRISFTKVQGEQEECDNLIFLSQMVFNLSSELDALYTEISIVLQQLKQLSSDKELVQLLNARQCRQLIHPLIEEGRVPELIRRFKNEMPYFDDLFVILKELDISRRFHAYSLVLNTPIWPAIDEKKFRFLVGESGTKPTKVRAPLSFNACDCLEFWNYYFNSQLPPNLRDQVLEILAICNKESKCSITKNLSKLLAQFEAIKGSTLNHEYNSIEVFDQIVNMEKCEQSCAAYQALLALKGEIQQKIQEIGSHESGRKLQSSELAPTEAARVDEPMEQIHLAPAPGQSYKELLLEQVELECNLMFQAFVTNIEKKVNISDSDQFLFLLHQTDRKVTLYTQYYDGLPPERRKQMHRLIMRQRSQVQCKENIRLLQAQRSNTKQSNPVTLAELQTAFAGRGKRQVLSPGKAPRDRRQEAIKNANLRGACGNEPDFYQ